MAKIKQRAKAEPTKNYCSKQHELIRAMVVPVKGRNRFEWVCACNGYTFTTWKDK